jgi:hypothetical protein
MPKKAELTCLKKSNHLVRSQLPLYSKANARGQLYRPSVPLVLQDVYFTIGHLFHGAVIDSDCKFASNHWKPDRGQSIPLGQVI